MKFYQKKVIDGAEYWTKKEDHTMIHLCMVIGVCYVYATLVLFVVGKLCV